MERVLVSGVSGPIGGALLPYLQSRDAVVTRLTRGATKKAGQIAWDPLGSLSATSVSGFDVVIHLAGDSIVGVWTDSKRKSILESRVLGTRSVAKALAATDAKPRVFICASAIGFYGSRGDESLNESSPAGQGFLPEVSREWEQASRIAADAGIRTVNIRIGLVLSKKGGALAKMLPPFKLGLGGRLGPGTQWWSWIHVDDIVGAIQHAIETESLSGAVNLVAPHPVQNSEFTNILAAVLHRPAIFPVPRFALYLAFGKMAAEELLLSSQRVKPERLESTGYTFRFPELRGALENLLR
jgi:uncharacterized protein